MYLVFFSLQLLGSKLQETVHNWRAFTTSLRTLRKFLQIQRNVFKSQFFERIQNIFISNLLPLIFSRDLNSTSKQLMNICSLLR
jgi:hypothetical protein